MSDESRYARQVGLEQIGDRGQRALGAGHVAIIGCGGLGSAVASALVRVGVGRLRLLDPDRVELSNLHRQLLFDEDDIAAQLPKVEAARRKLERINSQATIEAIAEGVTEHNVAERIDEVTLVIDATDNLEARYVINDACVRLGKPWVYGGVTGMAGMVLTIVPGCGPCFRCLFPSSAAAPTGRDDGGVFGPVPAIIAGIQSIEACKLLLGAATCGTLLSVDLWEHSWQLVPVARDERCLCSQAPAQP